MYYVLLIIIIYHNYSDYYRNRLQLNIVNTNNNFTIIFILYLRLVGEYQKLDTKDGKLVDHLLFRSLMMLHS